MSALVRDGLWSEQQREWLQALGHDAPTLAGGWGATAATPVEADANAAPPTTPATNAAKALPDSRLLRALASAAARSTQDDEFLGALPDLATLHRNPAARRALWPRLRALRKRSRG